MSHYAKIENNIVTKVIVAEQDFIDNQSGDWVQTSYNTRGGIHYGQDRDSDGNLIPDGGVALRKNYAGIGDTYDATRDAFISPQPYPSWVLDENSCRYEAPVPYPLDDKMYTWDESTTSWGLVTE
jgi:hypothetical protein